jgi:hypothetical protein
MNGAAVVAEEVDLRLGHGRDYTVFPTFALRAVLACATPLLKRSAV